VAACMTVAAIFIHYTVDNLSYLVILLKKNVWLPIGSCLAADKENCQWVTTAVATATLTRRHLS
jgi:hypothetical protein